MFIKCSEGRQHYWVVDDIELSIYKKTLADDWFACVIPNKARKNWKIAGFYGELKDAQRAVIQLAVNCYPEYIGTQTLLEFQEFLDG